MRKLLPLLLLIAFPALSQSVDVAPTTEGGKLVSSLVEAGRMDELRWPDFSDYRAHLRNFYAPNGYHLAWVRDGKATEQARAVIALFESADAKGIHAVDYDGARWAERFATLAFTPSEAALARFDLAVSVNVMRYISDLHIGRVNPQRLRFDLATEEKKYYLPAIVGDVARSATPAVLLAAVEPPHVDYRRLQQALARYRRIAIESEKDAPLPAIRKLNSGDAYAGTAALAKMLRRGGDLTVPFDDARGVYDGELAGAVKRFQARHGLEPNGVIGAKAFAQLSIPAARRVQQIEWALERWRWLPSVFTAPPIVVNIPEFRLRAWNEQGATGLTMRVVVGDAYNHQTPIFEGDMKYVVFRPYWNVPPGIQRKEMLPKLEKDPSWLARNQYELVTADGKSVGANVDADVLRRLRTYELRIRQKPGPNNALGLVKFMFPNQNNVYLHSTPAQTLFARERRDFSHGCIRVEDPVSLAAWVLRDRPEWTPETIRTAMNAEEPRQVNLKVPIPVMIVYATAVATEDGRVEFYDDIYGHDAELEEMLAGGYPYPW
jgi:murein L,D-transpeptidase YcbB/YkuD